MRNLKFSAALSEGLLQAMEAEPRLIVLGEGVDDANGSFGTTAAAHRKFGSRRVSDTPLSENAVTGIAVGAALAGTPVCLVHLRSEFALLSMDCLVNHAAKWRYMCGGSVPIVVRCIVGRGWGQAAQHSQSFHGLFAQIPGLKVILPSNAYDAKGLIYSALLDPDPVLCIEHRWLFDREAPVPEAPYRIPLGNANVVAPGTDATCVAFSYQVPEALAAREQLAGEGISLEVVDARSARPLDVQTILASVRKTGRLVVTDIGHATGGLTAEIAALAAERAFDHLKSPVARVALPECPTPCAPSLEALYYPTVDSLAGSVRQLMKRKALESKEAVLASNPTFLGPF